MRKTGIVALAALAAAALAGTAGASVSKRNGTTLTGAGSTFVQPLVAQWTQPLSQAFGIELQYSGIGSGGGIAAITNRTVDFGASDAPLSSDQFAACKGCAQIPWALSATAVIYNLDGIQSRLHMNGAVLAAIFTGRIAKWSDPAIRELNEGVALPDQPIAVVHRSDNSGTTYNFTDYLASVSPGWRARYGTGVAVAWPTGSGGRGSSGVAALVSQTPGAIGYVDVAYALQNRLKYLAIRNRSGKYATPGLRGILAAASSDQEPARDNSLSIVDPPAKYPLAYPISTFSYAVVPLETPKAAELRKFLFWAVTKGQAFGPRLLFQPIPRPVLVVAERTIARIHAPRG